MTSAGSIPMPPLELRSWVGPTDVSDFDNPTGTPIYGEYGIPLAAYDTVFDFGCGCGRIARQLLQQNPRPRRYVGIDVHKGLVEWCQENLTPVDPQYEFLHHDVYSPNYAPGNSLRLALPFPVNQAEFSLIIAHSVFTHLTKSQADSTTSVRWPESSRLKESHSLLGSSSIELAFLSCRKFTASTQVNLISLRRCCLIASGFSVPCVIWGSASG